MFSVICTGVSFFLYVLLIVSIPLRKKYALKKAGSCIIAVKKRKDAAGLGVLICCPVLIATLLLRNLAPYMNVVIGVVALTAAELTVRELSYASISGLYENGIIGSGRYISFDDIISLPLLQLPKNERIKYNGAILQLATKKHGIVQITFADETECVRITTELLKMQKRLKTR